MSDPKLPAELWMLRNERRFATPGDCVQCVGWPMAAFPSEQCATAALEANCSLTAFGYTPVRVLPPPDTLAALLADERWDRRYWSLVGNWRGGGDALHWYVVTNDGHNVTNLNDYHPTPEAAVRAALEAKGGA